MNREFTQPFNRRQFLAASTASLALGGGLSASEPKSAAEPVAFFLVGDTHFLADKQSPTKLDERSAAVTSRLVDVLNALPGTEIPATAGGGTVRAPRGLIHAGDCIDSGDKPQVKMQETEWAAFVEAFGLSGGDGRLKTPVYEVHGNHDSPRGDGMAVRAIVARNQRRPGLTNVSPNGVHYSWVWGNIHFVNLGIVVGEVAGISRRRRYAPLESLAFLVDDLRKHVGASGRPVVITHHVDVLRYAKPLPIDDQRATGMEWDPADVAGFHAALQGYTIAALLYGHTHARNVFRWNGSDKPSATGIPTFNVDNGSHFQGPKQALFYFEIDDGRVLAREYQTLDGWETGFWTPECWDAPI